MTASRAIVLALLCACKTRPESAPEPPVLSASAPAKVAAPKKELDASAPAGAHLMTKLVRDWNAAINAHDAQKLGELYADEVELYGTKLTREKAVAAKKAAFAKHEKDELATLEVTTTSAYFLKKSASKDGKTLEVMGYLEAHMLGARLYVVTEGDTTTDANLARKAMTSCENAVSALVHATPQAQKATKEIDDGAKLDPDVHRSGMTTPPEGPNGAWEIAICESHPERMSCYHHFRVDPKTAEIRYEGLGDVTDRVIPGDAAKGAAVRAACKP